MSAASCTVCGTAIHWPLPRGMDPLCHDANCRMVMGRRHTMPAAAFDLYLKQQVALLRSQRLRLEAHLRRVSQKNAREAAENEAHWVALGGVLRAQTAEGLPRLALPSGPRRTRPLAEKRRRRFRDHLNHVIAQALSTDPLPLSTPWLNAPPHEKAAAGEALRGQVCALCAGGCCTVGGDEAFITAATIRRVMEAEPRWRPRDVLAAYLDRVPPRSQEGSCINHTPSGCSLPRELRSETCNRFICPTQKALIAQQLSAPAGAPIEAVVALVRRQSHWNRDVADLDNSIIAAAKVSAVGITPLANPPPAPQAG